MIAQSTSRASLTPDEFAAARAKLPRLPVCVVIPAYNRASTLPRCLASVWSQRPALPAEVIVVDDGSTDDSSAVASAHAATVLRHSQNLGFAAFARNTGLRATSCEWVAFLDSDDEWLPDHLNHLWELRGDHALVGSSSLRCGTHPNEDRIHGPITHRPVVLHSPDRLISTHNLFTTSGCMIKRDVALELGGFQPMWGVEDFDLWVRLLDPQSAICSPRVTVIYHQHADNLSADGRRMLSAQHAVAAAWARRAGSSRVAFQRSEGVMHWDSMRLALSLGQRREALKDGLAILSSLQRALGVAILLRDRFLERRASARIGRDGHPSVALFLRDAEQRRVVSDRLRGRTVRDLSEQPATRALLTLMRRPPGYLVVASRFQALPLRVLRARTTTAGRVLAHSPADIGTCLKAAGDETSDRDRGRAPTRDLPS